MIDFFLKQSSPILDKDNNQLGLHLIYAAKEIPSMKENTIEYDYMFDKASVGLKTITYEDLMSIVNKLKNELNWDNKLKEKFKGS